MNEVKNKNIGFYILFSWVLAFAYGVIVNIIPSIRENTLPIVISIVGVLLGGIMLLALCYSSYHLAQQYKEYVFGCILIYLGINILYISGLYNGLLDPLPKIVTLVLGGLCTTPLGEITAILTKLGYMGELVVLLATTVLLIIFWLIGIIKEKRSKLYFN